MMIAIKSLIDPVPASAATLTQTGADRLQMRRDLHKRRLKIARSEISKTDKFVRRSEASSSLRPVAAAT